MITFDVSYKAFLGDRLLLQASVSSENNKPQTNKTAFQLELPVKYSVYTVISRQDDYTKHINFSSSDGGRRKEAKHRYRVRSWSIRASTSAPDGGRLESRRRVPSLLNGEAVWDAAVRSTAEGVSCVSQKEPPQNPDFLTQIQRRSVLDCSIADCLHFRCDIPSLGVQDQLDFTLKGNLSFGWVTQTLQKKVLLLSVAEITFNTAVYSQLPGQEAFLRAQAETVLEELEVYEPLLLVVGSSVGGLLLLALITAALYKLGFFKRHYKEMLDGKPADPAPAGEGDFSSETPPHLLAS